MKFRTFIIASALSFTSLLALPSQSAELKLGFVRIDRILSESGSAQKASKKIEAEFAKREQELKVLTQQLKDIVEKLDRDAAVMAASETDKLKREATELDRDLKRKQQTYREDRTQRSNEEVQKIVEQANKVIRQIADTEKFDLIFQDAVYVSPKIDLTERIIKILDK